MNLFKNISIKQKQILLLLAVAALLYMTYVKKIRATIELAQECKTTEIEIEKTYQKSLNSQDFNTLNESLQKIIGDKVSGVTIQNDIINTFNQMEDNNSVINQIFPQEIDLKGDIKIITNAIELQTNYKDFIQVCNYLEKNLKLGVIKGTEIYKQKSGNKYQKGNWIYATIYIQSIHEA